MTDSRTAVSTARSTSYFRLFLAIAGSVTVIRLVGLHFSVVDLYLDEAQYWSWSRDLAFGYFSKPPFIAWFIAATEAICGSGEACIRSASPILYFGTAVAIYEIGRTLYDDATGFWAGLLTMAAPGVIFSARIVSTDVPLLFFWALALLAFVKLRANGNSIWALALAAAIGLGLLSKYAMAYFLPGIILAAFMDRATRDLLRRPTLALAVFGGVLLLLPNLLWNIDNGFLTFRHLGDNASSSITLDWRDLIEFLAAQLGVAGPIVFVVLLLLIARLGSPALTPTDRMLVAYSLPALATITVFALLGNANANWAATAYISAFVVVAAVLTRRDNKGLLIASLVIGIVAQSALLVGDTQADRLSYPGGVGDDLYRRTMGGEELGRRVGEVVARTGTNVIVSDNRVDIAALLYYLRDSGIEVYSWPPRGSVPANHFELTRPLPSSPPAGMPLLVVSRCGDESQFDAESTTVERVADFEVAQGPTRSRAYYVFRITVGEDGLDRPRGCR